MMDNTDAACAEELRRFDRDRYLTTLFAPAARRPALWAIYAFNAEIARVRDAVREPFAGAIKLQWWRDVVDAIHAGREVPAAPVARGLAQAIARHRLSRASLDRLIDAREAELMDGPPADLEALVGFVDASSAPLIDLALEALAAHKGAAPEAARHIGIGLALSRILLARGTQLPADLVAAEARRQLAAARALRREVPRAALPALLPAVLAESDLNRLERVGYDLSAPRLTRPSGVSRPLRLALAAWRGRY